MKPIPLPHPAAVPTAELLALLAPLLPCDALAGGDGEDVLSLAEAPQDSRMPSRWISDLSSSIVCRTKAA